MRTITEKFAQRVQAQAAEAKIQGLTKVADHVERMIKSQSTRKNDASYIYAEEDFKKDVESEIWEGVVRIADFYDCNVDLAETQEIVEKLAEALVHEIRIKGGVHHGVGAYEPNVPGERLEKVALEVEEN